MARWKIIWLDYGALATTARNAVNDDPRPSIVEAEDWRFCTRTNNDNSIECYGVTFTDVQGNEILTLFQFPLGIQKLDA